MPFKDSIVGQTHFDPIEETVGQMTRDFTTVMPKTKSEVRRRIMELVEMVRKDLLKHADRTIDFTADELDARDENIRKSERERIRKIIREERSPVIDKKLHNLAEDAFGNYVKGCSDGWNRALDSLEEKLRIEYGQEYLR